MNSEFLWSFLIEEKLLLLEMTKLNNNLQKARVLKGNADIFMSYLDIGSGETW